MPSTTCSLVCVPLINFEMTTRRAGEFKKEYPEAKLVAVDEAVKKKSKEGLEFHGSMPFFFQASFEMLICAPYSQFGARTPVRDSLVSKAMYVNSY